MRSRVNSKVEEKYYQRTFYSYIVDEEVNYFFDFKIKKRILPGFIDLQAKLLPGFLAYGISYGGKERRSMLLSLITFFSLVFLWIIPFVFSFYSILLLTGLIDLLEPWSWLVLAPTTYILPFISQFIIMPWLVEINSFRRLMDRFILKPLIARNHIHLKVMEHSRKTQLFNDQYRLYNDDFPMIILSIL